MIDSSVQNRELINKQNQQYTYAQSEFKQSLKKGFHYRSKISKEETRDDTLQCLNIVQIAHVLPQQQLQISSSIPENNPQILDCPICFLKQSAIDTKISISRKLFKKYSSSQDYFYAKDTNEILANIRSRNVFIFKDYITYDDSSEEHLKRFYNTRNAKEKLSHLTEYYKYHSEIVRLFMQPLCKIFNKFHDKKRKIDFVRITNIIQQEQLKAENAGITPRKTIEDPLIHYIRMKPEHKLLNQLGVSSRIVQQDHENTINDLEQQLSQKNAHKSHQLNQFLKQMTESQKTLKLEDDEIELQNSQFFQPHRRSLSMSMDNLIHFDNATKMLVSTKQQNFSKANVQPNIRNDIQQKIYDIYQAQLGKHQNQQSQFGLSNIQTLFQKLKQKDQQIAQQDKQIKSQQKQQAASQQVQVHPSSEQLLQLLTAHSNLIVTKCNDFVKTCKSKDRSFKNKKSPSKSTLFSHNSIINKQKSPVKTTKSQHKSHNQISRKQFSINKSINKVVVNKSINDIKQIKPKRTKSEGRQQQSQIIQNNACIQKKQQPQIHSNINTHQKKPLFCNAKVQKKIAESHQKSINNSNFQQQHLTHRKRQNIDSYRSMATERHINVNSSKQSYNTQMQMQRKSTMKNVQPHDKTSQLVELSNNEILQSINLKNLHSFLQRNTNICSARASKPIQQQQFFVQNQNSNPFEQQELQTKSNKQKQKINKVSSNRQMTAPDLILSTKPILNNHHSRKISQKKPIANHMHQSLNQNKIYNLQNSPYLQISAAQESGSKSNRAQTKTEDYVASQLLSRIIDYNQKNNPDQKNAAHSSQQQSLSKKNNNTCRNLIIPQKQEITKQKRQHIKTTSDSFFKQHLLSLSKSYLFNGQDDLARIYQQNHVKQGVSQKFLQNSIPQTDRGGYMRNTSFNKQNNININENASIIKKKKTNLD